MNAGRHPSAPCVTVALNMRELTALRSLIVEEFKRQHCDSWDKSTWTPKIRRVHSAARKILEAQTVLREHDQRAGEAKKAKEARNASSREQ